MRAKLPAFLLFLVGIGGCTYDPGLLDPIRYRSSPAEVSTCRRLGAVGLARTDGVDSFGYEVRMLLVPGSGAPDSPTFRGEIQGPDFGYRVDRMRDAAFALGATDLLLSRRIYHDWSYVEGIAYRCRRR